MFFTDERFLAVNKMYPEPEISFTNNLSFLWFDFDCHLTDAGHSLTTKIIYFLYYTVQI